MSRRIEIELTSAREDGSWTWRAAGARQPRGVVAGSLLPGGAKAGDVVKADIETSLDGTEVLQVLAPRPARAEPGRIELVGRSEPEQFVTATLASRRGRRDERADRRDQSDGDRRGSDRRRGDRPPPGVGRQRPGGRIRPERGDRPSDQGDRPGQRGGRPSPPTAAGRPRPPRPDVPAAPKPKRLRARRVHRKAVLESLPEAERLVAEQVLRGGLPAVRQAVEKQNEQHRAEGRPEVPADGLMGTAERLLPRLRAAEWRDRADAALADLEELDLRDLRSVIVAAESGARDEESRELTGRLRDGLNHRVEREQAAWLAEIASTLADGRVVRALRLSSRPPKAGAPLPGDLASRLAEAAQGALSADTVPDRFATVLDALSFSPVHLRVVPSSVPAEPGEALLSMVRKTATRLPQIAALFGVEAPSSGPRARRTRGGDGRRPDLGPTGGGRGPVQRPGAPVPPPPAAGPPTVPAPQEATSAAAPEAAPTAPPPDPLPEVDAAAPEDPAATADVATAEALAAPE